MCLFLKQWYRRCVTLSLNLQRLLKYTDWITHNFCILHMKWKEPYQWRTGALFIDKSYGTASMKEGIGQEGQAYSVLLMNACDRSSSNINPHRIKRLQLQMNRWSRSLWISNRAAGTSKRGTLHKCMFPPLCWFKKKNILQKIIQNIFSHLKIAQFLTFFGFLNAYFYIIIIIIIIHIFRFYKHCFRHLDAGGSNDILCI